MSESSQQKTDVLGIISIICAFVGFTLPGFILGLVGAYYAKKEKRSVVLSRIGWILNLVFTIVFIILLIALVSFPAMRQKQRDSVRKNDLYRIAAELDMYYSDKGHYPSTLNQLGTSVPLYDPIGEPYIYTPTPEGCSECAEFTLEAKPEWNSRPSTFIITSEE